MLTESFAALRYISLLGQFITVREIKPDTQTQPTTVTLRRVMHSISYLPISISNEHTHILTNVCTLNTLACKHTMHHQVS